MKTTRKILPAIAMLVVSAVMLTTASFAWFAMNPNVTAKEMQVNVKSDSVYLIIADAVAVDTLTPDAPTPTVAEVRDAGSTSAKGTAIGSTELLPAAYYENGEQKKGDNWVKTAADLADKTFWYTASALSSDKSDIDTGTISDLAAFEGYVVQYRYYVTLSEGSNTVSTMTVKGVTIAKPDGSADDGTVVDPVRVVVACNGVFEEYHNEYYKYNNSVDPVAAKLNGSVDFLPDAMTLTSGTVAEIVVYVYYDGNDAKVFTEKVADLSEATISFQLTVK